MQRRRGCAVAVVTAAVLAAAGCSAGSGADDVPGSTSTPSGASSATAAPGGDGAGDDGTGGSGGAAADEGTVVTLSGADPADPLVERAGWRSVAAYGACRLSQVADPAPPATAADQRGASQQLLDQMRSADEGSGATELGDALLPLTVEPGTGAVGVNALTQDWTTAGGAVAVRGAARVLTTLQFDGSDEVHAVQLALDCPGAVDEAAWAAALADLRVTVPAQAEPVGEWPAP